LVTGLIRNLKEKYPRKKIVVEVHKKSPYLKVLFQGNPHLSFVTCKHHCSTKRHLRPNYFIVKETKKNIYKQLANSAGLQEEVFPELFFSEKELISKDYKNLVNYVTICPKGKQGFASNRKEWGASNFQKLVELFPQLNFVQIGTPAVNLLRGVIDARGEEIRKVALIMKRSSFFIGLEGGLMHLAKAVGTKSIIVYGGLISPKISGYGENINVYNNVDCSPCFSHSQGTLGQCESMKCMKGITVEMVAKKIAKWLD